MRGHSGVSDLIINNNNHNNNIIIIKSRRLERCLFALVPLGPSSESHPVNPWERGVAREAGARMSSQVRIDNLVTETCWR